MSKTTGYVLMLILAVPASAWAAFVASNLWSWFAEPLGAPHITVVRMMGFAVLAAFLVHAGESAKDEDEDKTGGDILAKFVGKHGLAPALFFGWLYAQFL